jgi:Tfp pilus assembly protein PilO
MTAIKLPNFIKKQPVALVCALICVGLALAIYFRRDALASAQSELDDKTAQEKHLKDNVDSANSLNNKADRLDEQCAAMTQAIQAIEARLVHADQSQLPTNLRYFYKLQSETQTKLIDLRQTGQGPSTKNGGKAAYIGVSYSIGVQGSYPQLLGFLRRLENGEHFSRVKGVTLSGGGDAAGKAENLSLSLNLDLLGLP